MFKMLRQFLDIYIIKYKADFSFLKTIQKSFYYVININEQFAILVLKCRR